MKHVVVQGLGFVSSFITVIASLKKYLYSVTGLEQNNSRG